MQAAQTCVELGARTRFCPVKLAPLHFSTGIPEVAGEPQTQQRQAQGSQSSTAGLPTWR